MTPFRTLLSILAIIALLGIVSFAFPNDGIKLGSFTLRFPSVLEKIRNAEAAKTDSLRTDPEEQIKKMLAETRSREFSAYADSLDFYESFFKRGPTRFDLPNDDPAWFDRFFDRVRNAKDSGKVLHIVHYGDSQLEGDRITSTLREYLQALFGGSGPGMLPPLADIPSMAFTERSLGNLSRHRIFGPSEEHASHDHYGPLAQVTDLRGNASFTFKASARAKKFPHAGTFQKIRLFASKPGLRTKLIYTATVTDTIATDSLSPKIKTKRRKFLANDPVIDTLPNLFIYTWDLALPTDEAHLSLKGNANLYTIVLDADSGIAVDNVAMRGSSGTIFHKMDQELLSHSLRALSADLILMEYGGNLVPSVTRGNLDWVEKVLERQIRTIHEAAPDADILFIGPADMSKKINGKWQSYPSLNMTIAKIREIALRNGCAYWDMHRVMGGDNSMIAWVEENPPLGGPDYIHFTRTGAAKMGELLYNAIKLHNDYFRFREAHAIDSKKLGEIQAFADSVAADTIENGTDTLILTPIAELENADNSETNEDGLPEAK